MTALVFSAPCTEVVASRKPSRLEPVSPMKLEAGRKPWRRKPSAAPAEQARAALAVAGEPAPARRLDRDQDRQPREARHRLVVQAARLRLVDRADPEGEPLGERDQQPGDGRGQEEGEDGVGSRHGHVRLWPSWRTGRPRLLDGPEGSLDQRRTIAGMAVTDL